MRVLFTRAFFPSDGLQRWSGMRGGEEKEKCAVMTIMGSLNASFGRERTREGFP